MRLHDVKVRCQVSHLKNKKKCIGHILQCCALYSDSMSCCSLSATIYCAFLYFLSPQKDQNNATKHERLSFDRKHRSSYSLNAVTP